MLLSNDQFYRLAEINNLSYDPDSDTLNYNGQRVSRREIEDDVYGSIEGIIFYLKYPYLYWLEEKLKECLN